LLGESREATSLYEFNSYRHSIPLRSHQQRPPKECSANKSHRSSWLAWRYFIYDVGTTLSTTTTNTKNFSYFVTGSSWVDRVGPGGPILLEPIDDFKLFSLPLAINCLC